MLAFNFYKGKLSYDSLRDLFINQQIQHNIREPRVNDVGIQLLCQVLIFLHARDMLYATSFSPYQFKRKAKNSLKTV